MAREHYALIGEDIARSPSPAMHNAAFAELGISADYVLRPTSAQQLDEVFAELAAGRWAGINVTRPLKRLVSDRVAMDANAARAHAVNTLVRESGGWRGYLTDVDGVTLPLRERNVNGGAALILGAGGAARAAAVALESLELTVHVAARDVAKAQALLDELGLARSGRAFASRDVRPITQLFFELAVVINASPVGTQGDRWELSWQAANRQLVAFDMVNTVRHTPFLREAAAAGLRVVGGWEMLVVQGAQSSSLWTGQEAPIELMKKAAQRVLNSQATK